MSVKIAERWCACGVTAPSFTAIIKTRKKLLRLTWPSESAHLQTELFGGRSVVAWKKHFLLLQPTIGSALQQCLIGTRQCCSVFLSPILCDLFLAHRKQDLNHEVSRRYFSRSFYLFIGLILAQRGSSATTYLELR